MTNDTLQKTRIVGDDTAHPGSFLPPCVEELGNTLEPDRYEVLELIASGGMAAIYRARQKKLNRQVAIKVLPHFTEYQGIDFNGRFREEALSMAALDHPNIVKVYDFGETQDGLLFLVMELIEGEDLSQLMKRTNYVKISRILDWLPQICDGLEYAHRRGVVHRDIKPANLMITSEGQIKIADFGLATVSGAEDLLEERSPSDQTLGTPNYSAPEIFSDDMDETADHRADIFSLGVVIYELLTGGIPQGNWKSPSELIPGLDSRFDDLVERAMQSRPENRFSSVSLVGQAVADIRDQRIKKIASIPIKTAPIRPVIPFPPAE